MQKKLRILFYTIPLIFSFQNAHATDVDTVTKLTYGGIGAISVFALKSLWSWWSNRAVNNENKAVVETFKKEYPTINYEPTASEIITTHNPHNAQARLAILKQCIEEEKRKHGNANQGHINGCLKLVSAQ